MTASIYSGNLAELILLILSLLGLMTAGLYLSKLVQSIPQAPRLSPVPFQPESSLPLDTLPSLSVIVPTYNEVDNVEDCLLAILNSSTLPASHLEVWLVDDQSKDGTWAIAQSLQQRLNDPRLHLLAGKPRPAGERWVGKSWACVQGAEQARGEYLLFLDADVRLLPGGIATALQTAEQQQAGLLTGCLKLECGCLAEWLVQPVMASVIMTGYPTDQVNDPNSKVAFAAGPFMLFRRSAYEQVGGHRAVGDQVVEDVALARRIKAAGLKLWVVMADEVGTLRMYPSWGALWEGWTKNLFLGSDRNFKAMVQFVIFLGLMYVLPWLLAIGLLLTLALVGLSPWQWAILLSALGTIALHWVWRYRMRSLCGGSTRYWWLTAVGGIATIALVIGSIIKTETGWGWTWRGRSLKEGTSTAKS